MLNILPFRGIHFDWKRVKLSDVLSPPYDVIPPRLARRLRALPHNAIHVELPSGGARTRYARARKIWRRWTREGWLARDAATAYYVLQQRFICKRRAYRRTGFLAALQLEASGLKRVIPHEKTLSKPKKDRLKLLSALRANTSPIFALYPDPRGTVSRLLGRIAGMRPDLSGTAPGNVRVRVWKVVDPQALSALRRNFNSKRLLIADGHHRLEVSKAFGGDSILCYLCAQEDPGLVMLPTHRVVDAAGPVCRRIEQYCRTSRFNSRASLERALERHPSGLAFGVIRKLPIPQGGGKRTFCLAIPTSLQVTRGIRSGLGVEWLAKKIFKGINPHAIAYTHDAREAEALVHGEKIAILIKSVAVQDVFRAVRRVGLLPQKSTYFYPKVDAGVVFNPVRVSKRP